MTSVTISIPEELRKKMKEFPEINWSGLVRKVIESKIKILSWKEEMLAELDKEEDFTIWSIEMGRKIKEERLKKLKR